MGRGLTKGTQRRGGGGQGAGLIRWQYEESSLVFIIEWLYLIQNLFFPPVWRYNLDSPRRVVTDGPECAYWSSFAFRVSLELDPAWPKTGGTFTSRYRAKLEIKRKKSRVACVSKLCFRGGRGSFEWLWHPLAEGSCSVTELTPTREMFFSSALVCPMGTAGDCLEETDLWKKEAPFSDQFLGKRVLLEVANPLSNAMLPSTRLSKMAQF